MPIFCFCFQYFIKWPSLFQAVLESPAPNHEDDNDLWSQGYMLPGDDNSPMKRWSRENKWCRPSCIPISVILILIFLVVLLPVLDHATDKAEQIINHSPINMCNRSCRYKLLRRTYFISQDLFTLQYISGWKYTRRDVISQQFNAISFHFWNLVKSHRCCRTFYRDCFILLDFKKRGRFSRPIFIRGGHLFNLL